MEVLQKKLPPVSELKDLQINVLAFEFDDDTNLHMDFVVAASNLRAENYNLPQTDKHKVYFSWADVKLNFPVICGNILTSHMLVVNA